MNKTEEYLDSLLDNISPEKKAEKEQNRRKRRSSDFLRDFEQELKDTDMDDFLRDFEMEVDTDDDLQDSEATEDSFFDNLEGIVAKAKENIQDGSAPEKPDEELSDKVDTLSDDTDLSSAPEKPAEPDHAVSQETADGDDTFQVNTLEDDGWTGEKEKKETQSEPEIEPEAQEILDMLSDLPLEDEESGQEEGSRQEKTESEASGMQEDAAESAETMDSEDTQNGKKKKKDGKKGGFFQKIAKLLFGEEEEEEQTELPEQEKTEAEQISEEELANMTEEEREILQQLNATGAADSGDAGKEKEDDKKKKKKEKKEKKKKEKKPKKKKEKKPPKEKKPKKPKEIDLSPPLPKKPVILIFLMGLSILLFVLISSNLLGYSVSVEDAQTAYKQQDYVGAYAQLTGVKLKQADEELYQKTELLAKVQEEYNIGTALYQQAQYQGSLDAFICALGRYDAGEDDAKALGIDTEYGSFLELIVGQLQQFGVEADQARELYHMQNRSEYSRKLSEIIAALGLAQQ